MLMGEIAHFAQLPVEVELLEKEEPCLFCVVGAETQDGLFVIDGIFFPL